MLYLNFALDLEKLADDMINEIKDVWKDPFEAPVVIFPDPKLEQWFRLHWIKKNGALVNLNATTIERFLFDILVGEDDSKRRLQADMLMHVILAYLTAKDGKEPNYKSLDPDVERYLTTGGQLDENRLFDFASRTAALFLEYERSRPEGFLPDVPGILNKWDAGSDKLFFAKFNEELKDRESWQRKLYAAIFHPKEDGKSLLDKVFAAAGREYLTIPYLFKALKNGAFHEGKLPHDKDDKDGKTLPVFLFGLSGMGQFYRVLLQKFAEQHEVSVYAQNPCMEFWEDVGISNHKHEWNKKDAPGKLNFPDKQNLGADGGFDPIQDDEEDGVCDDENELLRVWGRAGRDNVKLWCLAANYDFNFSSKTFCGGTLLHQVQRAIAERKPLEAADKAILGDGSLDVTAAPTKIREVDALHTRICELLLGGKRIEDILVVCPRIDDYRTAIASVFDQTPEKKSDWKGKENEYLHVPYVIVDSPARASLTENAMTSLFAMLERGSITRPDFFELVRNPVVQAARGIKADYPDAWAKWAEETGTYRKRPNGTDDNVERDDWKKLKWRLLLARMSSDESRIGQTPVMPYSNIESSDDDSLCRFAECVSDLEKWIGFATSLKEDKKAVENVEKLDELAECLNKWIRMWSAPDYLKGETFVQKRVEEAFALLRCQFAVRPEPVLLNIVRQGLLYAARSTEYSCGNLFVNGVTFMKFAPNRTIPVKHLFFLGADESSFPGTKSRDSLDLRTSCPRWPGDDTPAERNRYAFLCQLMNTKEGFHISYVNRDLKKDAEIYPSSVVYDLRRFIGNGWPEKSITLDEKRAWGDLFTPKSRRNKRNYAQLLKPKPVENGGGQSEYDPNKLVAKKPPEHVTVYELASFLKDPFVFGVNRCLTEEAEANEEQEQFEPLCLTALETSGILKKMVLGLLFTEAAGESAKAQEKIDTSTVFGENQKKSLEAQAEAYRGKLENEIASWTTEKRKPWPNVKMQVGLGGDIPWCLSGSLDVCDADAASSVNKFVEIHSGKTSEEGKLRTYVKALAILAAHAGGTLVEVSAIDVFSDSKEVLEERKWQSTPEDARKRLQKIYEAAFGCGGALPYRKEVDIKLPEKLKNKDQLSFGDYRAAVLGVWAHFGKKKLLNTLDDVGFGPGDFGEHQNEFVEQWKEFDELRHFAAAGEQQAEDASGQSNGIEE